MKNFIQKHEAVISYDLIPFKCENDTIKEGQIVPHNKRVNTIHFFQPKEIQGVLCYEKVELTKEMIKDFYNAIIELEEETIEAPFDNLPF